MTLSLTKQYSIAAHFGGIRDPNWVEAISELTAGEVVAIDGKTLRRSHDQGHDQKAIHMVSAWASQNRLVLGQVKVDDKSNEITAIPALLRLLALQGCIVTIDAMGHQTEIAAQIIQQGADYALALKENQGQLYREVVRLFTDALADPTGRAIPYATDQTVNKGHGRIEIRQCWTISQPDFIKYLDPQGRWVGLKTVVMIESHRWGLSRPELECHLWSFDLRFPVSTFYQRHSALEPQPG